MAAFPSQPHDTWTGNHRSTEPAVDRNAHDPVPTSDRVSRHVGPDHPIISRVNEDASASAPAEMTASCDSRLADTTSSPRRRTGQRRSPCHDRPRGPDQRHVRIRRRTFLMMAGTPVASHAVPDQDHVARDAAEVAATRSGNNAPRSRPVVRRTVTRNLVTGDATEPGDTVATAPNTVAAPCSSQTAAGPPAARARPAAPDVVGSAVHPDRPVPDPIARKGTERGVKRRRDLQSDPSRPAR
jgi:hypothetical protein